jgi:hypothetical protein
MALRWVVASAQLFNCAPQKLEIAKHIAESAQHALLQVALNATTACLAALPGGCASVPANFPNLTATNYLP